LFPSPFSPAALVPTLYLLRQPDIPQQRRRTCEGQRQRIC
jgi:hypothetical protein